MPENDLTKVKELKLEKLIFGAIPTRKYRTGPPTF